jgi:hypothetical protein
MAPLVHPARRMTDFKREPGAIDDPSDPGGQDVEPRRLPPGDTADDVGASGEPEIPELDLPGPDDPVAWNYVEAGTEVVGPDGDKVGTVKQMVGTEEGIFHGVAVDPRSGSGSRMVPASHVIGLTPSRVQISLDQDALKDAEVYQPPG